MAQPLTPHEGLPRIEDIAATQAEQDQDDLKMYPVYYLTVVDAYTERRTLAVVTTHTLPTESQTDHANALLNVSQFLFKHYPQADWIDLHRPDDMQYVGRIYPRPEL